MSSLGKLKESDLVDVHDALCKVTNRLCLSPLEVGYLLEWVEAGVLKQAVRNGFLRLRRREKRRQRPTRHLEVGIFEDLEGYVMEAQEELVAARLGSA